MRPLAKIIWLKSAANLIHLHYSGYALQFGSPLGRMTGPVLYRPKGTLLDLLPDT